MIAVVRIGWFLAGSSLCFFAYPLISPYCLACLRHAAIFGNAHCRIYDNLIRGYLWCIPLGVSATFIIMFSIFDRSECVWRSAISFQIPAA
jgi:hypothetical protein